MTEPYWGENVERCGFMFYILINLMLNAYNMLMTKVNQMLLLKNCFVSISLFNIKLYTAWPKKNPHLVTHA